MAATPAGSSAEPLTPAVAPLGRTVGATSVKRQPLPRPRASRPVPLLIAVTITTLWTVLVSVVPLALLALAVWAADNPGSVTAAEVLRFVGNMWLLAHGVPLSLPSGQISLAPLLLTAFICWRIIRTSARAARVTGSGQYIVSVQVVLAVALVYGLIGAIVASLARTDELSTSTTSAGLITGGLAAVFAAIGVGRENHIFAKWWRQTPAAVQQSLRGATIAVAVVLAGAALILSVMLAFSAERAQSMFGHYEPGIVGVLGVFLVCLLYLPTVLLWALAYLVGPGFVVGEQSVVSAQQTDVGLLPAFPLFAAIPQQSTEVVATLLVAIPFLAGMIAGIAMLRSSQLRLLEVLWTPLLAGVVTGLYVAALTWWSSGSLGGDRLTILGPSWWRVGVFSAMEIAAGALLGAVVQRWVVPLLPGRSR